MSAVSATFSSPARVFYYFFYFKQSPQQLVNVNSLSSAFICLKAPHILTLFLWASCVNPFYCCLDSDSVSLFHQRGGTKNAQQPQWLINIQAAYVFFPLWKLLMHWTWLSSQVDRILPDLPGGSVGNPVLKKSLSTEQWVSWSCDKPLCLSCWIFVCFFMHPCSVSSCISAGEAAQHQRDVVLRVRVSAPHADQTARRHSSVVRLVGQSKGDACTQVHHWPNPQFTAAVLVDGYISATKTRLN